MHVSLVTNALNSFCFAMLPKFSAASNDEDIFRKYCQFDKVITNQRAYFFEAAESKTLF